MVLDLAESLSPAEAAQREDHDSTTEESEPGPAQKKKQEKQQEKSILMKRSRLYFGNKFTKCTVSLLVVPTHSEPILLCC